MAVNFDAVQSNCFGIAHDQTGAPVVTSAMPAVVAGKRMQANAPVDVTHIASGVRGDLQWFDASQVTRFWSAEKYTLFVANGREQLTEESLCTLEARLRGLGFIRIHRGELVRINAVRAFNDRRGCWEVKLSDGQIARVSRRLRMSLRRTLNSATLEAWDAASAR
jgi:DNA-binding LytR/AlgR family response regulator